MSFGKTSIVKTLLITISMISIFFYILVLFLNSKDEDKNEQNSSTSNHKTKEVTTDQIKEIDLEISDIKETDCFRTESGILKHIDEELTDRIKHRYYFESKDRTSELKVTEKNEDTNKKYGLQSTTRKLEKNWTEEAGEIKAALLSSNTIESQKEESVEKEKILQENNSMKTSKKLKQKSFYEEERKNPDQKIYFSKLDLEENEQETIEDSERHQKLKDQQFQERYENCKYAKDNQTDKNDNFDENSFQEIQGTFDENIELIIKKYTDYADFLEKEFELDFKEIISSKPHFGTSTRGNTGINNTLDTSNERDYCKKTHLNEIRMWGISKIQPESNESNDAGKFMSIFCKLLHKLPYSIKEFVNEEDIRGDLEKNTYYQLKFIGFCDWILETLKFCKKCYDYGVIDGILTNEKIHKFVEGLNNAYENLCRSGLQSLSQYLSDLDLEINDYKEEIINNIEIIDKILMLKDENSRIISEIMKKEFRSISPKDTVEFSQIIEEEIFPLVDRIAFTRMKKIYHEFFTNYLIILGETTTILKKQKNEKKYLEMDFD